MIRDSENLSNGKIERFPWTDGCTTAISDTTVTTRTRKMISEVKVESV